MFGWKTCQRYKILMLKLFPKKWYKCAKCEEIWKKEWTDEECAEEYKENFPNDPNIEFPIAVICDDCYKEFKPWLDNLTPEEIEEIEQDYELDNFQKIEKKWFEEWRKEFPEDLKKLEESFEISEEFEEDLEKITEKFAERLPYRLLIPKEDEGSFTEYSDFGL